jgi:foldase protein PrsA
VNRGFLSKRNLAAIFGGALVIMVVIVAVAVGFGRPSVPSDDVAVIDYPNLNVTGLVQDGHISKANFSHFLTQAAKGSGLSTTPTPSSPQYQQVKTQAMQSALQLAWIFGEAQKEGVTVTDTQVAQALAQLKAQSNIKSDAQYQQALQQAGLTEADALLLARRSAIVNLITQKVNNKVSTPSNGDVEKYFAANKSQFTRPAQRTIRIVQNKDPHQIDLAYQALRTDSSDANWKKVAAQYSTDPTTKDKGGLRTAVVPGSFQQPLDGDIFKAPVGQVEGPVTTSTNSYVFEVISAIPPKKLSIDETPAGTPPSAGQQTIRQSIAAQLKSQLQNEALTAFGQDFTSYWTNLTQCSSDYLAPGCDNYTPPTCNPSKLGPSQTGGQAQTCPAPVFANCQETASATGGSSSLQCSGTGPTPAAPGSVKPFIPAIGASPQMPHPPGAGSTSPNNITIPGLSGAPGG